MTYSSTILADHPQAYYLLNESSGAVAHDSSGNGYDGTMTGIAAYSVAGPISEYADTGISFTSSGGLALPSTLNYTTFTALTIEFWMYLVGWDYVTITCDNTTTIVYVNSHVFTLVTGAASIIVGKLFDMVRSGAPAGLARSAIYNTALTPTQVTAHYKAAQPSNIRGAVTGRGRDGLIIGKGTDEP